MSNSFMRSSYFQTQVNNANVIKNCYPCGSSCTVISGGTCNCVIPPDLTLSTLTVNGKTTINGLIDPTGMEFTPVLSNPGGNPATTIWVNAMDMNNLYYGASAVTGGGGGWVGTATSDLNMNGFNIIAPASLDINANSGNAQLTLDGGAGNVGLTSGSGGYIHIGTNTVDGHGAEIIADDGIRLDAIGGPMGPGNITMNVGKDIIMNAGSGSVITNAPNTVQTIVDSTGFNVVSDAISGAKPTLILKEYNSGNIQSIQYDGTNMRILGDATNVDIINSFTKIKGTGGLLVGGGGSVDGIINVANRDETWAGSIAFNDGDKSLAINNQNAINIVSSDPDAGNTAQVSAWANNGGTGSVVMVADAPSGHAEMALDTNGSITVTATSIVLLQATSDITINTGASITLKSTGSGTNNALINVGENRFGVLTGYNDTDAPTINCDTNKLDQILSNNAYVPMTWYKQDLSFSINNGVTLAFESDDFTWRYSGQFGPSGLTGESRYCGAVRFQVDVNLIAEDMNDTIVWWVEIRDLGGSDYKAMDFVDERFGYVNPTAVNPFSALKNQKFSFSSVFDLTSAGSPPADGSPCRFRVFGYGTTTTTTPRANVSITIRPLRTMI